jgi:Helix-turn-helix domain
MTQTEKILDLLRQGSATNEQLNNIAYRYSARINDLRRKGFNIISEHIGGSKWRFTLNDQDSLFTTAQAIKEAQEIVSDSEDRKEEPKVEQIPLGSGYASFKEFRTNFLSKVRKHQELSGGSYQEPGQPFGAEL